MHKLSSRGFVIEKKNLSEKELKNLKDELTVSPKENHMMRNFQGESTKIIVYRENENKIYIPRFFGCEKYGVPHKNEILEGSNIDVPFIHELRDYQKDIVNVYLNHVQPDQCIAGRRLCLWQ